MAIDYWLKNPGKIIPRIRYWMWEKRNPDKPWLCPGTITFCQAHLTSRMKALEFGSGRSTVWFASLVGHLTSIEHHRQWYETVSGQLKSKNTTNVDYRFIALNHPESEPERDDYQPVPDYVAAVDGFPERSLNLVIVDGHYRTNCARHAISRIAPGGYLLVDDINMWKSPDSLPIPPDWRIADDSTNGVKRCIIWQAL